MKENEKLESEFRNNTLFNLHYSDTVSSFKIVPHHAVSTELMSTSCVQYPLSKH